MKDTVTYYMTQDGNCYVRLNCTIPINPESINGTCNEKHDNDPNKNLRSENDLTLLEAAAFLMSDDEYSKLCKWETYYNPWFKNAVSFDKVVVNNMLEPGFIQNCLQQWINLNDCISFIPDPAHKDIYYIHEDIYKLMKGTMT